MTRIMFILTGLFALALVMKNAQSEDSQAPTPTADLVKGAVDPFDAGGQRARFMRAAGAESELDEAKFKANAAVSDGFVRTFDKWEVLKTYDKNKNGTIDWFEASAYRDDLRRAMLAQYDTDHNGRLNDAEREAANKALAEGRIPALGRSRIASTTPATGTPTTGQPQAPIVFGGGTGGGTGSAFGFGSPEDGQKLRKQLFDKYAKDGKLSEEGLAAYRQEMGDIFRQRGEQMQAEFTKRYDKDGDGKLGDDERRAAFEDMRQQRDKAMLERYDLNKNGQIDEDERQKMREDFREQGRKGLETMFDLNGDGVLDDNEKAQMEKARADMDKRREEFRQQLADLTKKYDKDGDGRLSPEEWQAIPENERPQGFGRGGFGGRGGRGFGRPQIQ